MEYQKVRNLLDNTPNQLPRLRTKNWIEINDQSRGVYSNVSDDRFKTSMIKSSLCDYDDAYILVQETTTITGEGDDAAAGQADERNKGVAFTISWNIAIIIHKHTEIYGNTTKMSQMIT